MGDFSFSKMEDDVIVENRNIFWEEAWSVVCVRIPFQTKKTGKLFYWDILVSRGHDPFGQHQDQDLFFPISLSMRMALFVDS